MQLASFPSKTTLYFYQMNERQDQNRIQMMQTDPIRTGVWSPHTHLCSHVGLLLLLLLSDVGLLLDRGRNRPGQCFKLDSTRPAEPGLAVHPGPGGRPDLPGPFITIPAQHASLQCFEASAHNSPVSLPRTRARSPHCCGAE